MTIEALNEIESSSRLAVDRDIITLSTPVVAQGDGPHFSEANLRDREPRPQLHRSSSKGLPAADRHIDKPRLDFQPTGMASDPLGRQDRGARAAEGVEDDIAAARAVLDGVG
jgi:hypothetical protein